MFAWISTKYRIQIFDPTRIKLYTSISSRWSLMHCFHATLQRNCSQTGGLRPPKGLGKSGRTWFGWTVLRLNAERTTCDWNCMIVHNLQVVASLTGLTVHATETSYPQFSGGLFCQGGRKDRFDCGFLIRMTDTDNTSHTAWPWCREIGSLASIDAPELRPLTPENQFHCTVLYSSCIPLLTHTFSDAQPCLHVSAHTRASKSCSLS